MQHKKLRYNLSFVVLLIVAVALTKIQAFAGTLSSTTVENLDVTGEWTTTTGWFGGDQGSVTVSGTTITATVNGSSSYTTKVTLTNNNDYTGKLVFDCATNGSYSSFSESSSGKKTVILNKGDSITVSIVGKDWNFESAGFRLSNITFTKLETSDVTFVYDSSLGGITAGGSAIANNGKVTGIDPAVGVAVVAAPKSGSTFLGWINDSSGEVLDTAASTTLVPDSTMTIRAVFVNSSSNAWFLAGDLYMFDDLNKAAQTAVSMVNPVVIPLHSGTLPAGNYTIPSGVTLLVPYDDANTLCTTKPTIVETKATPSVYRMLTMASGAAIEVNGAISVSGQQYASRPIGAVSGKYGAIEMESGSSIIVNNGGKLYAWGYIAGVKGSNNTISEGTVTIKSGGTVYEDFQVTDWRGGNTSLDMKDNKYKVFPMSQYYVQNVQVPMTLESGATENTFTSVKVTLAGIQEAPVTFIGNGGMFTLGENSAVIKDYDEQTDRLNLELNKGSANLSHIKMSLKLSVISSTVDIDSRNYVLPVTNNLTITAKSGTSFSAANDVALLPGAEIIIEEGASCTLNSGSFYIYDLDEWMYEATEKVTEGGYCSEFNRVLETVPYVHDKSYTRTKSDLKDAEILVNGTVDVSGGYAYTTTGGANICSDGSGVIKMKAGLDTAETYQVIQNYNESGVKEWKEIPITSAQLKNKDGTYSQTTNGAQVVTYTYCAEHGEWSGIAETVSSDSKVIHHATTLTEAVSEMSETNYIRMVADSTGHDCTVGKKVYLDLAGKTVSNVTVSGGTLYGMDSNTDDYGISEAPNGTLTVTEGSVAPQVYTGNETPKDTENVGYSYLRCGDGTNGYTFNRFDITVTDYYVEAYTDGTAYVGFGATLRGDNKISSALTNIGFRINGDEIWAVDWNNGGFTDSAYKFKHTVETVENKNTAAGLVKFGADSFTSDTESIAIGNAINSFAVEDGTNAAAAKAAILAFWPVINE